MGKVGVITSRKTWINEEVQISVDRAVFVARVIEYFEDCSPFNSNHFDKDANDSNSEKSVEEDVEKGISDTWLPENDEDFEDGEIRLDGSPENLPEKMSSHDGIGKSPRNLVKEVGTTSEPIIRTSQDVEKVNTVNLHASIGNPHAVNMDVIIEDTGCRVINDPDKSGMGYNVDDVGPFTDNGSYDPPRSIPNSSHPALNTFTAQNCISSSSSSRCSSERKSKRRKRARGCRSPANATPTPAIISPPLYGNDPRPHSSGISLDLNRDPSISVSTHTHISSVGYEESVSNEIRQTVAIGTEVGFQIEADNHILDEVVGELGDNNPNQ